MSRHNERKAFLEQPHVAVLATVDPRGRPHAMPIWYLFEDGVIIMAAGRNSQKVTNIERNPSATLVVDKRTTPYYAVMVRGTAEIGPPLDDETAWRLTRRYLDEEAARRHRERTAGSDSVSIRLHPDEILEFHGQAGR